MDSKEALFVKTQDLNIAMAMKKSGFELIDYKDDVWVFLNNPKCPITFGNNKLAYSNMLCI